MRKTHILPLFLLTLLALAITACGVPSAPAAPTVSATAVAPVPETPVASAILTDETVGKLDALMTQAIDTEGSDPAAMTPGLIILVDAPDGRYLNAMGVASMEEKTPLQPDARMEIGSNSKSFTIVLLLQLQEEGKLSLDDPLSKWLSDWAEKIPYGDAMTLRQLAQHTAGLWDYGGEGPGEGIIGGGATDPELLTKHYTPGELVQYAIDNGDPYFEPGAEGQWHYSNTGYILLGMILEKVTGQSLAELYQERIFDPLDMESAILIEDVPAQGDLDSDGYFFTQVDKYMNTTAWNASQGWAAGALAMTADDLLTYIKALAAGELFQDPATLQEMLTFTPFAMDGVIPYGLGIQDFSIYGGVPNTWGHTGQTLGFAAIWFTNPEMGITVVGLSNNAAFQSYGILSVLEIMGLTP
jgi:D-alanyl-D-alanine carboxypeptidase